MCWERGKRSTERRDSVLARTVRSDGAEPVEEGHGSVDRSLRWSIKPQKTLGLTDGEELEKRPGDIFADSLGRLGRRPMLVRRFIPETPADTRLGAACSTSTLVSRCF
jgi:hypothetical protein